MLYSIGSCSFVIYYLHVFHPNFSAILDSFVTALFSFNLHTYFNHDCFFPFSFFNLCSQLFRLTDVKLNNYIHWKLNKNDIELYGPSFLFIVFFGSLVERRNSWYLKSKPKAVHKNKLWFILYKKHTKNDYSYST